jgi:nucleoid-associated protein YgaU
MTRIEVAGGNLFRIAAQYLGDANQWIRIAQLNGLNDPWLQGAMTLLLPSQDRKAGGGIATQ